MSDSTVTYLQVSYYLRSTTETNYSVYKTYVPGSIPAAGLIQYKNTCTTNSLI